MWCTDGATSYTANIFEGKPNYDLWVCSKCLKPSRLVFQKVTSMRAPKDATALLAVFGRVDGVNEITWATPRGKVTTLELAPYPMKVDMNPGQELLLKTWTLLDSKVDIILSEPNGAGDNVIEAENREQAKYEARGIAEVLALYMKPFYEKADDIVREAVARHKAKVAGEERDTPGLAEAIWNPQTTWDGKPRQLPSASTPSTRAKKRTPARPKPTRNLSPEELEGIRAALDSGMFDLAGVADMFKMTPAEVQSALQRA